MSNTEKQGIKNDRNNKTEEPININIRENSNRVININIENGNREIHDVPDSNVDKSKGIEDKENENRNDSKKEETNQTQENKQENKDDSEIIDKIIESNKFSSKIEEHSTKYIDTKLGELSTKYIDTKLGELSNELIEKADRRSNNANENFQKTWNDIFQNSKSPLAQAIRLVKDIKKAGIWSEDRWEEICRPFLGQHWDLLEGPTDNLLKGKPKKPDNQQDFIEALMYYISVEQWAFQTDSKQEGIKAILSQKFQPDQVAVLEFLAYVLDRLDPDGTGTPKDGNLWDRTLDMARDLGYEIIYPSAGTPLSLKEHKIAGVDRDADYGEDAVVRVEQFGFRKYGGDNRKAEVIVKQ